MDRICYGCGSDNTYVDKYNKKHWKLNRPTNLVLCSRCYHRYFINPIRNPIIRPLYKSRYKGHWLHYKDKIITLKSNPRKGICDKCGLKIGDFYIDKNGKERIVKRTHIHHLEYDDTNVLANTIELCHSCHTKQGWGLGQFDYHKGLIRPRNDLGQYIKQSL